MNQENDLTIAIDHSANGEVEKTWTFCRPYLVRYNPSGTYYLRISHGGRIVRKSLKTTLLTVACRKLPDEISKVRLRVKANVGLTMAHHWADYFAKVKASGIKPRSIDYREETWGMIKRTWKSIESLRAEDITKADCQSWSNTLRKAKSATRFNGCLETIRGIFSEAVRSGSCADDPTADIERESVAILPPQMPTNREFKFMLAKMDSNPQRRPAALVCRLLAFTGLRINEARHLEPSDIDLKNGWLLARVTKNSEPRRVPIMAAARPVLKEIAKGFQLTDPRRTLRTVSGGRLTPHDLRHLFATRCIEAGVDIRTIAGWLGHKDGGALLLKRYAHLRDNHSQKMAKKVRF